MRDRSNSAAISMIGNIFSELLETLPDPFVFSGYEESAGEEFLGKIKLQNMNQQLTIIIIQEDDDLIIREAIIGSLTQSEGQMVVENDDHHGIVEFINKVLIPKVM
jgi:hypothetical protein